MEVLSSIVLSSVGRKRRRRRGRGRKWREREGEGEEGEGEDGEGSSLVGWKEMLAVLDNTKTMKIIGVD